jgi:SAM-dependent methyltransferase
MSSGCCRFCGTALRHIFCDLGMTPLSNAYLTAEQLNCMEPFYPLRAYVCADCFLVQLEQFETPEAIFGDYAYFSSVSESWLRHAERYTEEMIRRFRLGSSHQVVEVASNDGYLLQYFASRGIPVLGIEPAANVARIAETKGIPTQVCFFGADTAHRLAAEGRQADLLLGNNVLAHVPRLNDFVAGLKIALKRKGVITMEFPHLLRLVQQVQFDTIYHEHFSYFSLTTVIRVFARHGLRLFDVRELPTHGGSLRIFVCHGENGGHRETGNVAAQLAAERRAGLDRLESYASFDEHVRRSKRRLLGFLIAAKQDGKRVVGYGAAAKGNTLLNYCGIRSDFIDYVVDRSSHKQGLHLPGTHLPICPPDRVLETRPDYLLILPWNLRDEIVAQMSVIRGWGGKFVVPIPHVEVLE